MFLHETKHILHHAGCRMETPVIIITPLLTFVYLAFTRSRAFTFSMLS